MPLKFLTIRSIPTLFWSAPKPQSLRPPWVSFAMLVIGLTLFGLGEALLVAADAGVSPWTVLAQGLMIQTGGSIGQTTFAISAFVLLMWIPLKRRPGIGTVLNAVIIAAVLEYLLPYLPQPQSLWLGVPMALAGVLITGLGGAIYLIANLGPGPRDGLMTGLQEITGRPIAHVRGALEVSVVLVGWLLGGTVGIGTVLFAFGIGPAVALGLAICGHAFGPKPGGA